MEKILKYLKEQRVLVNIGEGAGIGIFIWILHLMYYRWFGIEPQFFVYAPQFIFIGTVIGALIGLISQEIFWHKKK